MKKLLQSTLKLSGPIRHLVWWGLCLVVAGINEGAEAPLGTFRVGFSSSMFTDVNENDAKVAIKIWGQTIAKERGVKVDPEPKILNGTVALQQALLSNAVDAIGFTFLEYSAVRESVALAPLFVAATGERLTEQYVLLVHRDSPIQKLADLRGRRLVFHANARLSLAGPWLDTLLLREGLGRCRELVAEVTDAPKLTKVVLPVFFRAVDACVVSRSGFDTIRELNPQINKQLRAIEQSPELVPIIFCFQASYNPTFKQQLIDGIRELHRSPAGQQVLTIFHIDRLCERPAEALAASLQLIAEHRSLGCSLPETSGNVAKRVDQAAPD